MQRLAPASGFGWSSQFAWSPWKSQTAPSLACTKNGTLPTKAPSTSPSLLLLGAAGPTTPSTAFVTASCPRGAHEAKRPTGSELSAKIQDKEPRSLERPCQARIRTCGATPEAIDGSVVLATKVAAKGFAIAAAAMVSSSAGALHCGTTRGSVENSVVTEVDSVVTEVDPVVLRGGEGMRRSLAQLAIKKIISNG